MKRNRNHGRHPVVQRRIVKTSVRKDGCRVDVFECGHEMVWSYLGFPGPGERGVSSITPPKRKQDTCRTCWHKR